MRNGKISGSLILYLHIEGKGESSAYLLVNGNNILILSLLLE